MFKFNKANRNALMSITVLVAIICVLAMTRGPASKYQPRPIKIKAVTEESIFDLENRMVALTPRASPQVVSVAPKNWCPTSRVTRLRRESVDL